MLTDTEIAASVQPKPITEIAEELGLGPDEIEQYGRYKAKISLAVRKRLATRPNGKYGVTVASASFDGLALVEQHRLVNQALAAPLADGSIHELRITTKGHE